MTRRSPFVIVFALSVCIAFLGAGCAQAPVRHSRHYERTLLIALDGVPYDLIKELKDEGHFRDFKDPSRVISTFPSTSHCGFGGLFRPLGAAKAPGYDREYYSYEEDKVVSFLSSINPKNPNDYKNFFDYARKTPLQKFWIYASPGLSGRRDLEKIRRLVWKRTGRAPLFAYIGGTDGAGHVLGRKRLRRWLLFMEGHLEKMMEDYRRDFGETLHLVLFSDHGFHFTRKPNAVSRNKIENRLWAAGLHLAPNLKTPDRVVAVQWGNISGASFYAADVHVPTIAEILANIPGIDIVAYRSGSEIVVKSVEDGRKGTARIRCDEGRLRCRYQPNDGDPLGYGPVIRELRRRGWMDRDGYASSDAWFEATKDHRYPDALYRLHDGFFTLVENPAPILFSTEENYEYGDVLTRVGAWFHGGLKGTHGGLFQEVADAFVMTTNPGPEIPDVVRYDQVMRYVFDCGLRGPCQIPNRDDVDRPRPVP